MDYVLEVNIIVLNLSTLCYDIAKGNEGTISMLAYGLRLNNVANNTT